MTRRRKDGPLEEMPYHLSTTKDLLVSGELDNLYDSEKWDDGRKKGWHHHRTWKRHRRSQYHKEDR